MPPSRIPYRPVRWPAAIPDQPVRHSYYNRSAPIRHPAARPWPSPPGHPRPHPLAHARRDLRPARIGPTFPKSPAIPGKCALAFPGFVAYNTMVSPIQWWPGWPGACRSICGNGSLSCRTSGPIISHLFLIQGSFSTFRTPRWAASSLMSLLPPLAVPPAGGVYPVPLPYFRLSDTFPSHMIEGT